MNKLIFVVPVFAVAAILTSGVVAGQLTEQAHKKEHKPKIAYEDAMIAVDGLIDIQLGISCAQRTNGHGETGIANKFECEDALDAMITELTPNAGYQSQVQFLEAYKAEMIYPMD